MTITTNTWRVIGIAAGTLVGLLTAFLVSASCMASLAAVAVGASLGKIASWKEGAIYGAILNGILMMFLAPFSATLPIQDTPPGAMIYVQYAWLMLAGFGMGAVLGLILGALVGRVLQLQAEGRRFFF
jgi:hypothetical protein